MRINTFMNRFCLNLILLALLGNTVYAVDAPSSSLPGALLDDGKGFFNARPDAQAPASNMTTTPEQKEAAPVIEDDRASKETPEKESFAQTFKVDHFNVEGVTKLSASDVEAITKPYEGKETSFQDIQSNVVEKLNKLYEAEGYITTVVYVPPQKIADGVVTIVADEGIISEVVFAKDKNFSPRAVLPRVSARKGKVFKLSDLVKSLRRINENPDLTVNATLKPGTIPGETKVVLQAEKSKFPIHVTPFFDNLGRWPIGRQRLGVTVNDTNLLGFGDSAYISPYFTTRSMGILGGYEIPIGSHGTKIGFSAAHTHFDVNLNAVQFEGRSNIYQPYIMQELYRSEKSLLNAELAFAAKNSTFAADDLQVSRDRIRLITPAISYRRYDRTGQLFTRHELGIGLDVAGATLGSSALTSRPGAGSQFIRYTGSVARVQKLFSGTYGVFKAVGQYSPNELVSLEQLQVGGASTVRGYQEGRLIGDSGFVLSAEWHLPLKFLPERWEIGGNKLRENVEFVTFADFGAAFDNNAFTGVNQQSGRITPNAYALGVGGGLRVRLSRFLTARVDLGVPLFRLNPDKDVMRVHFGVESKLF